MSGGNIPSSLKPVFVAAGRKEHIDPAVLAGVADVETTLGADRSTSSTGAEGLMQFEPSTAASLGINPLNDQQAVFGAAKLLNQLGYQRDPLRALGAYNGGPGNPQYGYAHLVMSEAGRLRSQLAGVSGAAIGRTSSPAASSTPGATSSSSGPSPWLKLLADIAFLALGGAAVWRGGKHALASRQAA